VADVDVLRSLPEREFRAGFGEIVKCGLIRDPGILEIIEHEVAEAGTSPLDAGSAVIEELVARSVRVKAAVVAADERESGERAYLNLGHTYGHAIEAATGYDRHLHGEAVAIGTCLALRLGVHLEVTPAVLVDRIERLLTELGLPTRSAPLDRHEVWSAMRRDKKTTAGVRFVLIDQLGQPVLVTPPPEIVERAIDEVETQLGDGSGTDPAGRSTGERRRT
jgi:3-dehydroquinate synthetase